MSDTPNKPIDHKVKYSYKLSYRDHIRKFKAQKEESDLKLSDLSEIKYYPTHIFDINLGTSTSIPKGYWYKKCFRRDHEYKLDAFATDITENFQLDCYAELHGTNGFISGHYDMDHVTTDFMTGMYFAKALIRVRDENANWFHYGCAHTQLSKGIYTELGASAGKFSRYGADSRLSNKIIHHKNDNFDYKIARQSRLAALDNNLEERKVVTNLDNVFNGATKTGDLSDINVVKSIRNQLSEIDQLGFFIADVYPKTMVLLYNSLVIPLMDVKASGFSILRLPDPHIWSENATMIANFFTFVSAYFNVTKVFKTPWGVKAKYYLIISDRYTFGASDYTGYMRYLQTACVNDTPIISKKYVFDTMIPILNILHVHILECYQYMPSPVANTYWIENFSDAEITDKDDSICDPDVDHENSVVEPLNIV
jgi:hypothetical protein